MLLKDKKGIIVGAANKRSIAWGIAQSLYNNGATLAFTCQNEKLLGKVEALIQEDTPSAKAYICDASNDTDVRTVFSQIGQDLGRIDFLIHSIAFANREDLEGEFVNTSRDGFKLALDVSAYTLTALTQAALPFMTEGGSIVALTYLGSERVVPGYNVMGVAKAGLECSVRYLAHDLGPKGIRVNGISAGPVNTLAARGISGFTDMLKIAAERSPLRRNTTIEDVGDTALYLVSGLSRGMTGEILHVDNGLHILA